MQLIHALLQHEEDKDQQHLKIKHLSLNTTQISINSYQTNNNLQAIAYNIDWLKGRKF